MNSNWAYGAVLSPKWQLNYNNRYLTLHWAQLPNHSRNCHHHYHFADHVPIIPSSTTNEKICHQWNMGLLCGLGDCEVRESSDVMKDYYCNMFIYFDKFTNLLIILCNYCKIAKSAPKIFKVGIIFRSTRTYFNINIVFNVCKFSQDKILYQWKNHMIN